MLTTQTEFQSAFQTAFHPHTPNSVDTEQLCLLLNALDQSTLSKEDKWALISRPYDKNITFSDSGRRLVTTSAPISHILVNKIGVLPDIYFKLLTNAPKITALKDFFESNHRINPYSLCTLKQLMRMELRKSQSDLHINAYIQAIQSGGLSSLTTNPEISDSVNITVKAILRDYLIHLPYSPVNASLLQSCCQKDNALGQYCSAQSGIKWGDTTTVSEIKTHLIAITPKPPASSEAAGITSTQSLQRPILTPIPDPRCAENPDFGL